MNRRQLYIDKEAVATLGLLQDGLLYPAVKLMNSAESKEVNQTKKYNGITYPFSFILAPSGQENENILTTIQENEILDLVCDDKICGEIKADEVFEIDKDDRIKTIYGTNSKDDEIILHLLAHLIVTTDKQSDGQSIQQVASESVGNVSVSYNANPLNNEDKFFSSTVYGQTFKLLISSNIGAYFV